MQTELFCVLRGEVFQDDVSVVPRVYQETHGAHKLNNVNSGSPKVLAEVVQGGLSETHILNSGEALILIERELERMRWQL